MNISPSLTAAAYRFIAILVALGVAVLIVIFVPDPALKTVGAGLAAAAVLALEEYLKNSSAAQVVVVPSAPAILATPVVQTAPAPAAVITPFAVAAPTPQIAPIAPAPTPPAA